MNSCDLKEKIKTYLVAGYPGLYIHSAEEARVDVVLNDVATQLSLHPKEWNLGYGWVDFANKQPRDSQQARTDLADSLPSLLDDDLDNKLFVIKDARSALENQPLAVARLKQLLNRIQRHHRGRAAVVLVSETLSIPPEIEAQITLLRLPLPQGAEISRLLDGLSDGLGLDIPKGARQRLLAACSGLNEEQIRSVLAMVRQQHDQVDDQALVLIQSEKEQIISKSGVLEMLKVSESDADIGGLENLRGWLKRRADIFSRLDDAREARVEAPKGVLIAGMPGCGKSLTAKVAAGLFQLPLLRLDIGSLLGKYVGESEHNMRRALSMAESISPCILWIDELEKAFVGMNSGSGSEVSSRLFGYFLTWMQEKNGAVFVIATANNITALPPELLRKGRFDEVFYVGFPNAAERGAILDIHLRGEAIELTSAQRSHLVRLCRDYAGADIQNAVNEAREIAFLKNRGLKFEDLETAIEETMSLRETLRDQVAKYEELFEKLKLKSASTLDGLSVAQMISMADSPNSIVRLQIARNEDCPVDRLKKLVSDTDEAVRTAAYENPNCSTDLLTCRINIEEGQSGFDRKLLLLACLHANAPHDLIAVQFERLKLATEQRAHLAERTLNEDLQLRLLSDQAAQVRKAIAGNKSLTKSAQLKLCADADVSVRQRLVGNDNLDPEAQELLAKDSSPEVLASLASRSDLSEAAQLSLVERAELEVLDALARRSGSALLPDVVQMKLAECDLDVRLALAGNESLSAVAQFRLAQDPSAEVRCVLAEHPSLTTSALQYLIDDIDEVQTKLAGSSHVKSAALQRKLSGRGADSVRIALAGNPAVHSDVQDILSRDLNSAVRAALAANDRLSAHLYERFLSDKDVCVREHFASLQDLPRDAQDALAKDVLDVKIALARSSQDGEIQLQLLEGGIEEVLCALACNPRLGEQLQSRLADHDSSEVRRCLARSKSLSELVVGDLINDADLLVRIELAKNTHLSVEQYLDLLKSGCREVIESLAANPGITEALMNEIYQGHVEPQLEALARNANLPLSIQKALLDENSAKVKAALAANAAVDQMILRQLLLDVSADVRIALLKNPILDLSMQLKLAKDRDARVRSAVAMQRPISKSVQTQLAVDPDKAVRMSLLSGEGALLVEIQNTLANDGEQSIRELLAAQSVLAPSVQVLLAKDKMIGVRRALAKGGDDLCEEVQLSLARDTDRGVRLALAESQCSSSAVQALLAQDADVGLRIRLIETSSAENPLTRDAQITLARDSDVKVRQALAMQLFGVHVQRSGDDVQLTLVSDLALRTTILACLKYGIRRMSPAVKDRLLDGLEGDTRQTVEEMLDCCEER
ncbi:AAA family ATPase [Halopseudomonas aestusnigri]|uniref:AAA family ATPase n=1 Tax=Halopseudomonas aestusnigri TaxID=857252 RepID=UPI00255260BA|nr:AAA family ATPase [Halopseudomonas aestusnigri]MDL2198134.1 AAA family ATPase [Halopseudomonas aestusnigri]